MDVVGGEVWTGLTLQSLFNFSALGAHVERVY